VAPDFFPGPRLFLTRLLTAAVLLAAFFAALYLLDHWLFALLISAIIGLGGYEWARLGKTSHGVAASYGAACSVICGVLSVAPGFGQRTARKRQKQGLAVS
jgi:CDP-diglyceride synthetase